MSKLQIVSTTLSGNQEDAIEDALRSVVDWVDACILLDTGITDSTRERAARVAGDKLVVIDYPWPGDFAAARNKALDVATELGATWAVTLDSDERIHPNGVDIRATLLRAPEDLDAFSMVHSSQQYRKPRCIRTAAGRRWFGKTHEYMDGPEERRPLMKSAYFTELDKTPEQWQHKFERDAKILEEMTASGERTFELQRWYFYLGDTYRMLNRDMDAVKAYLACSECKGWKEECAYACFLAGTIMFRHQKYDAMKDILQVGMQLHPGLPELPWLMAHGCLTEEQYVPAICWAHMATALGKYAGIGHSLKRIGFQSPQAAYEGPYATLEAAYGKVGDDSNTEEAKRHFELAKQKRTKDEEVAV